MRAKHSLREPKRVKESKKAKRESMLVTERQREAIRGKESQRESKRAKGVKESQREAKRGKESAKERQREPQRATESQREAKKVVLTTTVGGHLSSHFGPADDMPGWHPEGIGLALIRPSGLGAKCRFLAANQLCWDVINAQF